jgi:hypothetical protein
MPDRSRSCPRDPNQLGDLIVDIATGEADAPEDIGKDPAAVTLRRGGRALGWTANQRLR